MEIKASIDKKDLKNLDKDLDKLLIDSARAIGSSPKMQPIVDKVRRGLKENEMRFSNDDIWKHHKEVAKRANIIDFDSPLMVSGQLVNDFIFVVPKHKWSQVPKSNEYVLGWFTFADKERKRPTKRNILNQTAIKRGYGYVNLDAPQFTYIKTSELVKLIMASPRFPIMEAILNLYRQDIQKHCERAIDEAFKKRQ